MYPNQLITNMKKIILVLALVLGTIAANAQIFPIAKVNNHHYEFGFQGGAIGIGKEFTRAGFGINATAWGVYIDFLLHGAEHSTTTQVGEWEDTQAVAIHLGYQIPITQHVRIIPLVGYGEINSGITNGYKYSVDKNGIHNSYKANWRHGGFDAGGSLCINFGFVSAYLTGTIWSVSGGIGFAF